MHQQSFHWNEFENVVCAITFQWIEKLFEPGPHGTIDASSDGASDIYGLTSREIQILRHLALGKSDSDISVELNISVRTINTHVGKIILKLGVNNRTHAVAKALIVRQIEMRASDSPPNKPNEKRKVARVNVFKIRGMSVKRSDDDS